MVVGGIDASEQRLTNKICQWNRQLIDGTLRESLCRWRTSENSTCEKQAVCLSRNVLLQLAPIYRPLRVRQTGWHPTHGHECKSVVGRVRNPQLRRHIYRALLNSDARASREVCLSHVVRSRGRCRPFNWRRSCRNWCSHFAANATQRVRLRLYQPVHSVSEWQGHAGTLLLTRCKWSSGRVSDS